MRTSNSMRLMGLALLAIALIGVGCAASNVPTQSPKPDFVRVEKLWPSLNWGDRAPTQHQFRSYDNSGRGLGFFKNGDRPSYALFEGLNIIYAKKKTGYYLPIEYENVRVDSLEEPIEMARNLNGGQGTGAEIIADIELKIRNETGGRTDFQYWCKSTVLPSNYPERFRPAPTDWQNMADAFDLRMLTGVTTSQDFYSQKHLEHQRPSVLYLMDRNIFGVGLKAVRELKSEHSPYEAKVGINHRNGKDRLADIATTIMVFRSGGDKSIRCLAYRIIQEFEPDPEDPAFEIRSIWVGVKIFNDGPVVESLRDLKMMTSPEGIPAMATPETTKALDAIAESDGWLCAPTNFSPRWDAEVVAKANGEPMNPDDERAQKAWHSSRIKAPTGER